MKTNLNEILTPESINESDQSKSTKVNLNEVITLDDEDKGQN